MTPDERTSWELGRGLDRAERELAALARKCDEDRRAFESRLDALPYAYADKEDLRQVRDELREVELRLLGRISENRQSITELRTTHEAEIKHARSQLRGAVIVASFSLLTGVVVTLFQVFVDGGVG